MTQAQLKTRKDYLSATVTYDEYQRQFVTSSVLAWVKDNIGIDAIKASTDEHLNDIPLHKWDRFFYSKAFKETLPLLRAAGDVNANSLCNAVCIAKTAARML